MIITIEALDVNNWLKICNLSVSEEQKQIFTVPNVYWIGISRYEEHSELFAIKQNNVYVGFIGGGLDEDGISGYINPLMIDEKFQKQGIAEKAMQLMMKYLICKHCVLSIHINHRKTNPAAGRLYEKLGFSFIQKPIQSFAEAIQWIVASKYYLCVITPNVWKSVGYFCWNTLMSLHQNTRQRF